MNLGERIKTVREIAGMTITKAAKEIGVSNSLWSLWESGQRTISPAHVLRVAMVLGVSLDYLMNATIYAKFSLDSGTRIYESLTKEAFQNARRAKQEK